METSYWIITIKEVNSDHTIETEYLGNIDRKGLIDFYGLEEPDVEWYKIEELWPIKEEGECCEQCNYNIVLPNRIEDMISKVRK